MNDDDPLAFDAKRAESKFAIRPVKKITWAMAGRVTEPGRYMLKFGWLTVTADDLAIWQDDPSAAFTLVRTLKSPPAEADEEPIGEEFRLGTFELYVALNYSEGEK